MRVTLTGATGLIGRRLVAQLVAEGVEVTVLSRDPAAAGNSLGVQAVGWDPLAEPAPAEALRGRDAVVHLAGANVAQRWSPHAKREISESRVLGTRHLVEGLRASGSGGGANLPTGDSWEQPLASASQEGGAPKVLVSSSAIGYYGARGEEPLDEEAPRGSGFLAEVCAAWEAEAAGVLELGMRSVVVRTGVVLDRAGGALAKMLPPFRLGIGGPVAGGRQYVSWIHLEDLVEIIRAALDDERWMGPVNGTAPEPVTNRELSHALGATLHRPALLPVPGLALRVLYGEMAEIVTTGARVLPAKALVLGYRFRYPHLPEALDVALGG